MSGKSALRMTILATLFLSALVGFAQTDARACPGSALQASALTAAACDSIAPGQVCLNSGSATSTSLAGDATRLLNPGDRSDLANIERLQTHSMTADPLAWTTLLARLDATDVDGAPTTIDMLVIGDVVLKRETSDTPADSAAGTAVSATIEAAAGVIVRRDANAASDNIWQLQNGVGVRAIGRSPDGEWIRIMIPSPNGGAGWVFGRFIAVEGGSESLPYQTSASPIPRVPASTAGDDPATPRLRMESLPVPDDCVVGTASGIVLQSPALAPPIQLELNGVTLRLAGTVFVTAQIGGNMSVFSFEGTTEVSIDEQRMQLPARNAAQIALDASLSPIGMPDIVQPFSALVSTELDLLPLRLLPRATGSLETVAVTDDSPVCPAAIKQSYDSLAQSCAGLTAGSACLGLAGPDMSRIVPVAGISGTRFARPGDITDFAQAQQLAVLVDRDSLSIWPSARLALEADTSGGDTAVATLLLLGEVELTNRRAASLPETDDAAASIDGVEATVDVAGSISVRDLPRVDTDSVTLVDDEEVVIALQRSLDQQWILIETEDGTRGWIVAQFLRLPDGIDALPVHDPAQTASAESAPSDDMQDESATGHRLAVDLKSRDGFPGCAAVPPGGLLIQSPSDIDGVLQMTVNGALLELTGTAYLTATDESMTLYSLEGAASFDEPGASTILFEGEQMTLPLSMGQITEDIVGVSQMYSAEDGARLSSLPINLTPRAFDVYIAGSDIASVATGDTGVETPDADSESPDEEEGPPTDEPPIVVVQAVDDIAECVINAGGLARNLRQGPGTDFQVIGVLQIGQTVLGQSQKRGAFGLYWYHTDRGWIRFDAGEMSAACARLPLYIAAAGEFDEDEDESDAPLLHHESLGDVCAAGGAVRSATIRRSGNTYHEFSGLWTARAGASITFSADISYFHESFGNVVSLVNENGSFWLGSLADASFTVNFADTRSFRVRVSGLLGDNVSLSVSC